MFKQYLIIIQDIMIILHFLTSSLFLINRPMKNIIMDGFSEGFPNILTKRVSNKVFSKDRVFLVIFAGVLLSIEVHIRLIETSLFVQ